MVQSTIKRCAEIGDNRLEDGYFRCLGMRRPGFPGGNHGQGGAGPFFSFILKNEFPGRVEIDIAPAHYGVVPGWCAWFPGRGSPPPFPRWYAQASLVVWHKLRPVVDDPGLPVGRDPAKDRADTHPDTHLVRPADELRRQARPLVELDDRKHVRGHLLELLARCPDDGVCHDLS